jgi:hypothetical protein
MTDMILPHFPAPTFPAAGLPSPLWLMPELPADPLLDDDPVGLICELHDAFAPVVGEGAVVDLWALATGTPGTEPPSTSTGAST